MAETWLIDFVRESNHIEGIEREPTRNEIAAHKALLASDAPNIEGLVWFVAQVQPDARLREKESVPGVRVGNHIAPPSGPAIRSNLDHILSVAIGKCQEALAINGRATGRSPYDVHRSYETLHPFTDGNGRSGRALWLWMMLQAGERQAAMAQQLGFLHSWYYQSLENSRP